MQDTVIKMLLQPLVENAILHAFNRSDAPAEGNLLLVRVFAQAGDLVLEVANNAPDDAPGPGTAATAAGGGPPPAATASRASAPGWRSPTPGKPP